MKYLIIVITSILLIGCSNPTGTGVPYEPIEYEIAYQATVGIEDITQMWYYNPERDEIEYNSECILSDSAWYSGVMTAFSGQTLSLKVKNSGTAVVSGAIQVNGEIVAESIIANSIYVEYILP